MRRVLSLTALLLGCSTEQLVARPVPDASAPDASAAVDAGTDTSHIVVFDAPFEARPAADAPGDETTEDACGAYCACMRRTCDELAGYPYVGDAGDEQCLGVCRAFSEKERTCWSRSCRTADTYADVPTVHEHLCQHAWGTFGLAECP